MAVAMRKADENLHDCLPRFTGDNLTQNQQLVARLQAMADFDSKRGRCHGKARH
jgi:hypothetical protein